jgi:hypothetical protein
MIQHLLEILTEHNIKTEQNKAYDIFIPSHNIAINYIDIAENCETPNNKNKLDNNLTDNILLLQVFSDEWILKPDIVTSIICSKLGIFHKRAYARQCKILRIDSETKNDFLAKYHIQGKDNGSIRLGLYLGFNLLSVMTFGRRNITGGKSSWEMLRFCNKLYTQVVGGASKLFKYFITNYNINHIVTYADRRWSVGNLYFNMGFKLKHKSSPNYYYTKDFLHKLHRVSFQKHKLTKLAQYDSSLTEYQNMLNNGYHRIWDAGNYVFEWHDN